jgi:hypothetical protein
MMIKQQFKPIVALTTITLSSMLMISSPLLHAGERESLEQLRSTTLNLIDMLVSEGVLSKSKADILKKDAEAARLASEEKDALEKAEKQAEKGEPINELAAKTVRVQYVPEFIKKEMREEVKKELMTKLNYKAGERLGLPDWIDRIEWTGDLRLRYQRDAFADGNALPIYFNANENRNAALTNTSEDRDRMRVRARLGANIKINDWLSSGIRMTTGSNVDPVSPNQTMESVDSKFSFALDRVFLKAKLGRRLTATGGRMENPFFGTDMVWDPDLAFDGAFAKYTPELSDTVSAFVTGGAFPIDEIQSSDTNKAKSKWLVGGQAGIQWKTTQFSSKFAVGLYNFENTEGILNPLGDSTMYKDTAPAFRQKGNRTFSINKDNGTFCGASGNLSGPCGLVSKFQQLNLTGQIDLATFDPVHIILTGDYVKNIGFDANDFSKKTGQALGSFGNENQGAQAKLSVGTAKVVNANDWEVFGAYKYLQADAVLDAFTDSDFHLGGTNAKGWIVGASYGIDKNAWLTGRWISTDQITGLPLGIDVLMLDLNAKF